MPVRVVVVTTSYPSEPGDAAGHFVRAEVVAMRARGHHVTVVTPKPGGAFGWPGAAARIRERPVRALSAAWWVGRETARMALKDCDRVVAHWALPCALPVSLAARGELEIVSHGGDVRALLAMPPSVRSASVGLLLARSSVWRFVSARLLLDLSHALPTALASALERRATVIPATIDLPDVRGRAAEIRRSYEGRPTWVCAARLVPKKSVCRAIRHVAGEPSESRPDLVVVGDGPERTRLAALADELGVRARFLGTLPRAEALAHIAAADALIHASLHEGLSTVVREATAYGTRVIDARGAARGWP